MENTAVIYRPKQGAANAGLRAKTEKLGQNRESIPDHTSSQKRKL